MERKIVLEYGKGHLELEIPFDYHVLQFSKRDREINWEERIKRAFMSPIASPTLTEIVRMEKVENVLILVNDITRPVPYEIVLKPMLDELLSAGISRDRITLLIAAGMHRPMTAEEVHDSLGDDIASNFRWENHNCDENLVYFGELSEGVPLYVNSLVKEADLLCAVGVIAPHYMAGYSGGRKSLLPGVCGRETIEKHHSLMKNPASRTANLEGNPFHRVMLEAAEKCGLRFIANVVADSSNEPVELVAGHWLKAWEEGVKLCQEASVIPIKEAADIVIVSAGGYPKDINMYQAQKALENASYCVKKGGIILLLAECSEGLGESVFERWLDEADSPEDLEERINRSFELGGHKAYAIGRTAANHSLYLYSSLDEDKAGKCFMTPVSDLNKFLQENISAESLVYIMPHGANTVPSLI